MNKEYYLIGSLRNEEIPHIGNRLRQAGLRIFDQWWHASPDADDYFQKYSNLKGLTYKEALKDHGAENIFSFDKHHLDRTDGAILVLPAGKSAHIEFGYVVGLGKPAFILFDGEPDRYDIMVKFATDIAFSEEELVDAVRRNEAATESALSGGKPITLLWDYYKHF